MPAGTYLYAPVNGTVVISGGVPYYTYYGNGEPGVGELLIETDAGDHVILGHMAAIAVSAGERVTTGQFVGLSGGENGDHLHLETRVNGLLAIDPRRSFLIESILVYGAPQATPVCGETLSIDASADAWIAEADPESNGGHSGTLLAGTDESGQALRTAVAFRLPGAIPPSCAIAWARLELKAMNAGQGAAAIVQGIVEPWDESTVSWTDQPESEGDPVPATLDDGVVAWDVTAIVGGG
jgi:hypothetical protein